MEYLLYGFGFYCLFGIGLWLYVFFSLRDFVAPEDYNKIRVLMLISIWPYALYEYFNNKE